MPGEKKDVRGNRVAEETFEGKFEARLELLDAKLELLEQHRT
jgi:hypothetical protein